MAGSASTDTSDKGEPSTTSRSASAPGATTRDLPRHPAELRPHGGRAGENLGGGEHPRPDGEFLALADMRLAE